LLVVVLAMVVVCGLPDADRQRYWVSAVIPVVYHL